jgi:hypothetical protein
MESENCPERLILDHLRSHGGSCPLANLNNIIQRWCDQSENDRKSNAIDVRNEAISVLVNVGLARCYDVVEQIGFAQATRWIRLDGLGKL